MLQKNTKTHALSSFFIYCLLFSPFFAFTQPTISKVFTPSTIGPGSVTTITFTIDNTGGGAVTDLAFTDVLPPGVTIATPANATIGCNDGTTVLSASDGGGTITFSNGRIGAGATCTITVDVTSSTFGKHTNSAFTLSSSAGSSMSLPIDLTVEHTLPGFSKSFSPSSIQLGGRSTLTFTIDNTANASPVGNLDFTDNLPAGMVIADPSNATTDCISASAPDTKITAIPGTSTIILDANGSTFFPELEVLPVEATCTATVDVIGIGVGTQNNITGDLLADFTSAGKASATLNVTVTPLSITKSFTNDPVPPGETVELEFSIVNRDRSNTATEISFTDDLTTLAPALAGLTFGAEISNDCGGDFSGVGTTTIGYTGGTLASGGSCTCKVSLTVPAGTTPGSYTNTTSTITATIGGVSVTGNTASEDLFVEPVPLLTKEFLEVGTLAPNPVVNPGDDVVLRFTVTNTSTTSAATAIAFIDELTGAVPNTGFLPFPLTVTLPPVPDPPCGVGSSLGFTSPGTDRQALSLTGGNLTAAPGAGSTCTFDVTVTIPEDMPPGNYTNTTEEITATVDGATRTGKEASDGLTIIAAPSLSKSFLAPIGPGATGTLEFTLSLSNNSPTDATAITFTDDLNAHANVMGLTTTGLPLNDVCGMDATLFDNGSGRLTFSGGTLAPGESCTFSVPVNVPAAQASGTFPNTTSGVSATVSGQAATSAAASADLTVAGLTFTKKFLNNPVIPGGVTTLRFTIDNIHPTEDATITFFTDNLSANLSGLAAIDATNPPVNTCGGMLSGTTTLVYVGGSVLSGETCTIEVPVQVPAGAANGSYGNITSSLAADQGGAVTIDPATDALEVNNTLLQLGKSFTDDPIAPGDDVTLEFTLTNLDATNAASDIDFTDNLGSSLAGLTFNSVLLNDCGATVSGTGTDLITVTDASLAAGGTCTIRTSLTVPAATAAGTYPNTTSAMTGTINTFAVEGDPASDDLEIIQLLTFSKSFDGPTTATGTATLTFTITNPGTNTATGLKFSDNLNDVIPGLIATSLPALPCGAGSSITGIGTLKFEGGELAPSGGTCSFDVEVTVPASVTAGTFVNQTSKLTSNGLVVSDTASANLTIEPPPTFAKAFASTTICQNTNTTLTFTIDNSASAVAASALAFTDNLPAGLLVAATSSASTTCTGGTITANAASGVISYTGGSVAARTSCSVQVEVTATASGMLTNPAFNLTSSSGTSGATKKILTVDPEPVVANQTTMVCSDVATALTLGNDANTPSVASYNITAITMNGLTASAGSPATGTGLAANVIEDDAFTNTTAAAVDVVYTVVPVATTTSCEGDAFTVTITVNPEPVVANQTTMVCSDLALNYSLDDIITGSGDTYSYTVVSSDPTNVTAGSARVLASAANITDTYTNTTGVDVTITYTITPISSKGCIGSTFTLIVTVKPELVATINYLTICMGTTSIPFTVNATVGSPTTYTIDYDAAANTAGFVDVTTAVNIDGATFLIPASAAEGTYNGIITYFDENGCSGTDAFTLTVKEIESIPNPPLKGSTVVCPGFNSTTLRLGNFSGTILMWQSSTDPSFTNAVNINVTTNTYTAVNLSQVTHFRVVLSDDICSGFFSGVATISIQTNDSDNDTVIDCLDVCPGGDDTINSDNTGMPDACDCEPTNPNDEFVVEDGVAGTILPGTYRSSFELKSKAVVSKGNSVTFIAGNRIILEPGFEAKFESTFSAFIITSVDERCIDMNIDNKIKATPDQLNISADSKLEETTLTIMPNPFSNTFKIVYNLEAPGQVDLRLYYQSGQLVKYIQPNQYKAAGQHQVQINTANLPEGLYLISLYADGKMITKRGILSK